MLRKKSSLLREGTPPPRPRPFPQQSVLQPCQKRDSPAPSGPERFATIDSKAQVCVEKKAPVGDVAGLRDGIMPPVPTAV